MRECGELGKVFRDLRENRNISLKEIADENVSISQLSRFERGETDLSVTRFFQALANMKVEINEYMDLLQKYERSETIEFMSRLIPLEYERNVAGFEALLMEQQQKYKEAPHIYQYRLNAILAQGFICKCDPSVKFPKEYMDEIQDYLFSVEEWKSYELILIGNLYLFIDTPLLHRMGQEILGTSAKAKSNRILVTITLLNIFEVCLQRRDLEIAAYYKEKLPELIKNETYLYERNLYHFLLGLYEYELGEKAQGKEKMQQAIQIYQWLGCENLAENYQKDYEKYI